MSFVNIFMGDATWRKLLQQIDTWDKAGGLEKQTVDLYLGQTMRAKWLHQQPSEEISKQLSGFDNETIKEVCDRFIEKTNEIMDTFLNLLGEGMVKQTEDYVATLENGIDGRIYAWLREKPEPLQKAYWQDVEKRFPGANGPVRQSELIAWTERTQRHKSIMNKHNGDSEVKKVE